MAKVRFPRDAVKNYEAAISSSSVLVAHNIDFDATIVAAMNWCYDLEERHLNADSI